MSRWLFLIVLSLNSITYGQLSMKKSIKKLGIAPNEVLYSEEALIDLPVLILYHSNITDSVSYILDVNPSDFDICFNEPKFDRRIAIGTTIGFRKSSLEDSITIRNIEAMAGSFRYENQEDALFLPDATAKYVAVLLWNPEILTKTVLWNIKEIQKYIQEHPELKIQLIFAVATIVKEEF